jgi:hypothetical protein
MALRVRRITPILAGRMNGLLIRSFPQSAVVSVERAKMIESSTMV